MKYLFIILLFCYPAISQGIGGKAGIGGQSGIGGGYTASAPTYTLVHTASGTGSSGGGGNGYSLTVSSSSTGDLLMAFMHVGGGGVVSSMTDNKSQTWTCPTITSIGSATFCYFLNSASGVTSVTPTASVTFATIYAVYAEYSGPTSLSLIVSAWNFGFTSGWTSNSLSPSSTSLGIGIFQVIDGGTINGTNGWTNEITIDDTTDGDWIGIQDYVNVPSGARTATGSNTVTGGSGAGEAIFH